MNSADEDNITFIKRSKTSKPRNLALDSSLQKDAFSKVGPHNSVNNSQIRRFKTLGEEEDEVGAPLNDTEGNLLEDDADGSQRYLIE